MIARSGKPVKGKRRTTNCAVQRSFWRSRVRIRQCQLMMRKLQFHRTLGLRPRGISVTSGKYFSSTDLSTILKIIYFCSRWICQLFLVMRWWKISLCFVKRWKRMFKDWTKDVDRDVWSLKEVLNAQYKDKKSSIQFWFYLLSIWENIAFLLNQYLMFQRYSGFCNMQMRCLMTSSTQHRPNKLAQMRNISSNNCAHWNVPFVLA